MTPSFSTRQLLLRFSGDIQDYLPVVLLCQDLHVMVGSHPIC